MPLLITLQRGIYYCERRQLLAGRIGIGNSIQSAIYDYLQQCNENFTVSEIDLKVNGVINRIKI